MREKVIACIERAVSGYHEGKYWRMRFALYNSGLPKLLRYWYFYRLRRIESKNHAVMGTQPDGGARFGAKPVLPHGIFDIAITAYATLGKNVTICPGVKLVIKGKGRREAPCIGDYVYLGTDALVIGGVKIGDHAIVGAGSVVTKDVPDGCIVVGNPARIIRHGPEGADR